MVAGSRSRPEHGEIGKVSAQVPAVFGSEMVGLHLGVGSDQIQSSAPGSWLNTVRSTDASRPSFIGPSHIDTATSLVEPLIGGLPQPAAGTTDDRPHRVFIELGLRRNGRLVRRGAHGLLGLRRELGIIGLVHGLRAPSKPRILHAAIECQ